MPAGVSGPAVGPGGAGVSNLNIITTLTNSGAISGGAGAGAVAAISTGGAGAAKPERSSLSKTAAIAAAPPRLSRAMRRRRGRLERDRGKIRKRTNNRRRDHRRTTQGSQSGKAVRGAGVSNAGTVETLSNKIGGAISGGSGIGPAGVGGAGVSNSATIESLVNSDMISGGNGARAGVAGAAAPASPTLGRSKHCPTT